MPPIQRPDISRSLARQFGIVGFAGPESLSPEIVPVVIVESLAGPDVNPSAAGAIDVAAVAAEFGAILLRNPGAGGKVVEVYQAHVTAAGTANLNIATVITANDLADGGNLQWQDRHLPGIPTAILTGEALVAAFQTTGQWKWIVTSSTVDVFDLDYTLLPGDALAISCTTANLRVLGGFAWRERALEPSDIVS